jgi:hypothetical protein
MVLKEKKWAIWIPNWLQKVIPRPYIDLHIMTSKAI